MMSVVLSPSGIGLFLECSRCFWLDKVEGIKRPASIFPSLPSGMDRVLKEHFDWHRGVGSVPEEFGSMFKGGLFPDLGKLKVWRNNLKGLRYVDEESGATLMGALDDLFITEEGRYAPIDFKTRGYPINEETSSFYQHQMDLYSLLLEKNGLPPADYAILIFYHPTRVSEKHDVIFNPDPVKLPVDRKQGERIFKDATNCLRGEEPKPNTECEWCKWIKKLDKTV